MSVNSTEKNDVIFPNAFTGNENQIQVGGAQFEIVHDEWSEWHNEGFRFRTYSYNGLEPSISDGADIQIKEFGHTPVQALVTQKNGDVEFYYEQPLKGDDLKLLYLTQDGRVGVERFTQKDLGKTMATIKPNMIMCWFAGKTDKGGVSEIRESEYPGFDESDLATVPYRAGEINGINIPIKFWDEFDQLDIKQKLDAPKEFDDDGKYTNEYVLWWQKTVSPNLSIAAINRNVSIGASLNIPNYRLLVSDLVGNLMRPLSKGNPEPGELGEAKQMFTKALDKFRSNVIISGFVSLEKVDKWAMKATESEWKKESVGHLIGQWEEILKPINKNLYN